MLSGMVGRSVLFSPGDDSAAPDSVMLPKVADGGEMNRLTSLLVDVCVDCPMLALAESAVGVLHAEAIAAADATDTDRCRNVPVSGGVGVCRK